MKKGLAIVLAAATALTFAPVSTLGLQGVVEAQAATVKPTDDSATVTLDGSANASLSKTGATVKAGGSLTLTFENSSVSAIADAKITAKKASSPSDTGLTVTQDDAALTGASSVFTLNSIAAKSGATNGKTTVVISFAGTAATGTDYTFDINYGTGKAAKTLTVDYTNTADAQTAQDKADADTALLANKGNISGVDSNIYIQRSKGSSVTITPSYVTENGKANNAANYKFTVTQPAPDSTAVASVPVADLTGGAGKINVEPAATGSVKLTVDKADELTLGSTTNAFLVAYKLDSSTGMYTPVSYNAVTIHPYAVSADLVLSDKYNSGVSVILGRTTTDSILANADVYDTKTGTKIAVGTLDTNKASIAFKDVAIASITADGNLKGEKLGSETATITVPYTTVNGVEGIATKQLRVNVISDSSSVIKVTADGSKDAANLGTADAPIRLNVKSNKTFDLSKYVYVSDPANTTIAYKSDNNKNTVSDAGVVNATAAVDQFIV
ncbi:MAG: hypothetical protein II177_01650, partial [Lachnospiraceae bacterium]|nr:hypothetical protein [Lachnospiraceae bacterium]